MRTARARPETFARSGFTLLETALALVIVMVGVLAITDAQRAFIQSNSWSSHEATGTYLAGELRERMRPLPRHDPVTGLHLVDDGMGGQKVQGLGLESGEVVIDDFDDVDDYDQVVFGQFGAFDGPIDAFGRVVPEIDGDGVVKLDGFGNPLPLQGWSQRVVVEKVDPFDYSTVRAWKDEDAPSGNFAGRAVDQFPLRVTVSVFYQGPFDEEALLVTSVSWIVPN